MNTEILDTRNDTCANCGQMYSSDQLMLAELRVGSELYHKEYWIGNISSVTGYQISEDIVNLEICYSCIRKKRLRQWLIILAAVVFSLLLVLIDYLLGLELLLGQLGLIVIGTLILCLPKYGYRDVYFCDRVAAGRFRKDLPEELRKNHQFRIFTRGDMKDMK